MEFKNLAEVTKLEEVPEGASVLAATAEGEVVRVPGDGLGGGGQFIVNVETVGEPDEFTESETGYKVVFHMENATLNKSPEEIKAAYEDGVLPIAVIKNYDSEYDETFLYTLNLSSIIQSGGNTESKSFVFSGISGNVGYMEYAQVVISPEYCEVSIEGRSQES